MTLEQLAKRLRPTFLNAVVGNSYQPCRVFLAASDMKTRAITRHASAAEPLEAFDAALDELKSALGSIKPTILRADWIIDAENMTWQDFLNLIGKTRRNYFRKGFALPDFSIAFTECELNANQMLYKDGKDGNKYCVLRPDKCDQYCNTRFDCDFPKLEPNSPVVIFTTNGAFMSEDEKEPLLMTGTGLDAGHRDASHVDDATFLKCARTGAAYLAGEVQKSGRFIYGHYPCFDRIVPSYNTLRHFSSIFAMLDVYSTYNKLGNAKLASAITRALKYGIKNFITYRKLDDGTEAAYLVDINDEIKLGALGVSIVMLAKYCELMKTRKYIPLMEKFARGILTMQNPDGSFVHVLNSTDYSVKEPFRIVYYDGEAIFGLMRLYSLTKEQKYLEISERAFQRFIATEHWRNHDHWLSYSINELSKYQPKAEYFEFGINNFLDFLPFIYHRDTQYPTLLELTMAADAMLENIKSRPDMHYLLERVPLDDFYAAMEARAKNLLNGYFWPELAMFFKRPESIAGAFFIRHHAFRVRTDDVEHFLSSFVNYRRYLARRDHDPIPSQKLLNSKAIGDGLFNMQAGAATSKSEAPIVIEEKKTEIAVVKPIKVEPVEEILEPAVEISAPVESSSEVKSFIQEFNARNGVMFFMLRNIKATLSGLELSSLRRAELFEKYFDCEVRLLTNEYQNSAAENLARYYNGGRLLNMYDFFQSINRALERERRAELPPIDADCVVEYVGSDMRIRRGGQLLMYVGFDGDNQKLRYINFFDGGKKIRRDIYDSLGFLSRRQLLDRETELPTEAIYHRPDGTPAVKETYSIVDGKSVMQSLELVDKKLVFKTTREAIKYWLEQLTADQSKTYFMIGDRSPEYSRFYIDAKRRGLKNIFVIHQLHSLHVLANFDPMTAPTKRWYNFLTDPALKSDAIITLTKKQKSDIVKRYGLKNITVIPHAMRSRKEIAIEREPFKIVAVGRLVEEKNPDKILQAFKLVRAEIPQAVLHFCGTGPMAESLKKTVAAENLEQAVFFDGFRNDIDEVFASSALSVSASRNEGFSLVVQESLQNDCPVAAFDCNYGPSDMIEDGVNGFLVPVDDVNALAERMIRILSDEGLRKKLSDNAARSIEQYSQSIVAEKWARLFNDLMSGGDSA